MFRHFGGLPIVKASFAAENEYDVPRATVEETVNFMIGLLDEAATVLPWDLTEDGEANWQGRMTKAAAMGLKCKILLFAASPLFNDNEPYCTAEPQEAVINHQVWYGGYKPELWKACLTACEEFFQALQVNGHYELVQAVGDTNDAYRAAFNKAYFLRENSELLISTRIIGKYNWDWWYYWGDWVPNGGYTLHWSIWKCSLWQQANPLTLIRQYRIIICFLRIMIIINLLVIHVCMKQFW